MHGDLGTSNPHCARRPIQRWCPAALAFCLSGIVAVPVFAQVTVHTTTPSSMTACGPAETFTVLVANAGPQSVGGIQVRVTLPAGVEYEPGSVGGDALPNVGSAGIPIFPVSIDPLPVQTATFTYRAFAKCGFVDRTQASAVNMTHADYTGSANGVDETSATSYARLAPLLRVTNVSPQEIMGNVGDTVPRDITITNEGNGTIGGSTASGIGRFTLSDLHGPFVTIHCPPVVVGSQSTVPATVVSCTPLPLSGGIDVEIELPQPMGFGDYVTIRESVEITDCDYQNQADDDSDLEVSWGCGAATCDTMTHTAEVKPPWTAPAITITPTVMPEYCFDDATLQPQEIKIENTATAPARDVMVNLSDIQNSYTFASAGTFEFKVGSNPWAGIPACGTQAVPACIDSLGFGGGQCGNEISSVGLRITRIDKQTAVFVRWQSGTCLPPGSSHSCGNAFYRNWWRGAVSYAQHQCDTNVRSSTAFDFRDAGKPAANVDQFVEAPTDARRNAPIDVAFVNTAFVLWQGEPSQYLVARFELDTGLLYPPPGQNCSTNCTSANTLIYLLNAAGRRYYPDEVAITGPNNGGPGTAVTARFEFGQLPPSQQVAWEEEMKKSEFRIGLETNCDFGPPPSSVVRLELTHHLTSGCNSAAGIPLTCTEADVAVHCPGCQRQGILTEDFSLARTTFGVADNDDNAAASPGPDGVADDGDGDGRPDGSLDDTRIKKNRASVGDEIHGVLDGVVNVNANYHPWYGSADEMRFDLTYGYYRQTFLTNGDKLTELDGQIEIWDWSQGGALPGPPTYTCQVPPVRGTNPGAVTFDYDFSISELLALGNCNLTGFDEFHDQDHIRFTTRFKVTDDVPLQTVDVSTVRNHIFLGGLPHTSSAPLIDPQPDCNITVCDDTVQYYCERWSGAIGLVGYEPLTSPFPLTRVFGRVGGSCETELAMFDFVSIGDRRADSTNFFPFEHRRYLGSNVVNHITIPPGFFFVPGSGRLTNLRSAGTNLDHLESIDVNVSGSVGASTLTFDLSPHLTDDSRFAGNNDPTVYVGDETDNVRNYFKIAPSAPSCLAPTGPQPLGLRAEVSYAPIVEWPAGSGNWLMETELTYPGSTVSPDGNFRFVPPDLRVMADTKTGKTREVCWRTQILNNATNSDAGYVWFDAYSPSGNIVVKNVTNLRTALSITPDPNSQLYHLGEIGAGQGEPLEICANYSCIPNDTLEILTGWDCEDYPANRAAYPCTPGMGTLTVQPEVAELHAAVTAAPASAALCDVTPPYTIVVNAAAGGGLYDTRVLLELPRGLSFHSAEIDYPYNPISSSPVPFAAPVAHPIRQRTWVWDQDLNAVIGTGGLPGNGTNAGRFAITFRLESDCDFMPRTKVGLEVESRNNCGDTLMARSEHSLDILGFPDFRLGLSLAVADFGSCDTVETVFVSMTNTGSLATGANDFVKVLVPSGLSYVAGSFSGGLNAPPNPVPAQTSVGQETELSWQPPPGVVQNDLIEFSFDIARDDTLTCGPFTLLAETTATGDVPCVTGGDCLLEGVTGSARLTVWTEPPVLLGVPDDTAIECDDDHPEPANVTGECEKVAVAYAESRVDGRCPDHYLLQREWMATDPCGMSTVDEQIITVDDTRPPMIVDCIDQVVDADDYGTAPASRVSFPTATDACDSAPNVVCGNPDPFPVGVTRVTCTATDRCGNQDQCFFDVTVIGGVPIPPVRDLLPSRVDPDGSVIDLRWDVDDCPALDYHLIYGELGDVAAHTVTGSRCGLGTNGTAQFLDVPLGNQWFLLIGSDGAETEGSWGESTAGFRNAGQASDQCGSTTRDDSGTCP